MPGANPNWVNAARRTRYAPTGSPCRCCGRWRARGLVEVRLDEGRFHVHAGAAESPVYGDGPAPADPDAVLTLDTPTCIALSRGDLPLTEAIRDGRVEVTGDSPPRQAAQGGMRGAAFRAQVPENRARDLAMAGGGLCGPVRADRSSRQAYQALHPLREAQMLAPRMLPARRTRDPVRARRGHRVGHTHPASGRHLSKQVAREPERGRLQRPDGGGVPSRSRGDMNVRIAPVGHPRIIFPAAAVRHPPRVISARPREEAKRNFDSGPRRG